MASIQRIVGALTNTISYRVQPRVKGQPAQSETFPNRKQAEQWAKSIEAPIREGRHFAHAAAKRTSFDALAKHCTETVLADFDPKERATHVRQLAWWSKQFSGLSLAEITADRISQARDKRLSETFWRGNRGAHGTNSSRAQSADGSWTPPRTLCKRAMSRANGSAARSTRSSCPGMPCAPSSGDVTASFRAY